MSETNRNSLLKLAVGTLFLILLVVAYVAFTGNGDPAKTGTKVVYAMPITVAAIPAYVAAEKGFWKDEGLEVETKMFSAGRLALDALISQSAEVMSVSETPLVHAILKGNEIYIVATVTEHQEVKFIGRKDQGIEKPEDLRGKRIATLPGTNSDYFMFEFLKANGLSIDDIKVTSLPPPDMVTALVSRNIDGYFAWEPHISYAQKRIGDEATVFSPGDLYQGRHCVAMNRKYVEQHPDVVEKLVRGFLRAEEFVAEHPEEAKQIVAKVAGLELDTLNALWDEYHVRVELDKQLLPILEKEAVWARTVDPQAARAASGLSSAVYTDALRAVRPDRVEIDN